MFGGRDNRRAAYLAYRLAQPARVRVEVLRGGRVVRTYAARDRRANETYRLRFGSERRKRGDHRFRLTVAGGGRTTVATLTSRRL